MVPPPPPPPSSSSSSSSSSQPIQHTSCCLHSFLYTLLAPMLHFLLTHKCRERDGDRPAPNRSIIRGGIEGGRRGREGGIMSTMHQHPGGKPRQQHQHPRQSRARQASSSAMLGPTRSSAPNSQARKTSAGTESRQAALESASPSYPTTNDTMQHRGEETAERWVDGPVLDFHVQSQRKGASLSHLFQFQYDHGDRGQPAHRLPPRARRPLSSKRAGQRMSREQYTLSVGQFYLRPDGDYSVNIVDPDAPLHWDFAELVSVRSDGEIRCPICLGPPVAAHVTRCGHIYCW